MSKNNIERLKESVSSIFISRGWNFGGNWSILSFPEENSLAISLSNFHPFHKHKVCIHLKETLDYDVLSYSDYRFQEILSKYIYQAIALELGTLEPLTLKFYNIPCHDVSWHPKYLKVSYSFDYVINE